MNTFKRKALSCAILGGLGAVAGTAHAVYEDPNGLGQALIYPYYTVQTAGGNSFNTYMSVVNTTTRAKAVKVRFREGKNSREVLDFNLYLSPNDVWTSAIGPASADATSGAVLFTGDKSCTAPAIPAGGVAFRNFSYVGGNADNGPATLDRTREGYFEIIEMANLTGAAASAVTHNSAGVPANCAFVQPENGFTAASNSAFLQAPSGGLTGTYTLINVSNGLNFGGNATALAQFSSAAIYTDIGNEFTNLASANPPVAVTVANQQTLTGPATTVYVATYASGRDAVSATMMHSSVINEYGLDVATKSATDWVLTFPTKQFYVSNGTGPAIAPFSNNFTTSGSCEPISFTFFNREEATATAQGSNFSPLPPGPAGASLCWEAQVLSIVSNPVTTTASSVLGSQNYLSVAVNGFQNGWARLGFTAAAATVTGLSGTGTATNATTGAVTAGTVTYHGLPVIGFMARTLNNGALSCTTFGGTAGTCAGSYGALFDHKYEVAATP